MAGLLVGWLTDYYLAATLLLLALLAGWRWIRQPAHRIMAAWIVLVELIVLAVVCAMPFWPRVSLMAAALRRESGRAVAGNGLSNRVWHNRRHRIVARRPSGVKVGMPVMPPPQSRRGSSNRRTNAG